MHILLRNKIPFFSHLTVSWSLPVARIIFLKSSQIQYGGFTKLLCKIVKCLERKPLPRSEFLFMIDKRLHV